MSPVINLGRLRYQILPSGNFEVMRTRKTLADSEGFNSKKKRRDSQSFRRFSLNTLSQTH